MRELLPNVLLQLRNLWILWLKNNSQIVPICLCLWWKRKKQKTQKQKKQKEKDNYKNNKKVLFFVFVSWVFCFLAVWRERAMAMMLVKKLGHHHPCCVHGRLSNNPTTIEEAHHKTQNCNVSWSTTLKPPTQQPHLCICLTVRDQNYNCKWKLQLQIRMQKSLLFVTNTDRFHTYICQEIWRSLLWGWCCFARGILDGSIVIYEYIFLRDRLDWWSVQKDSEIFSKPDQWKLGSRIFLGFA